MSDPSSSQGPGERAIPMAAVSAAHGIGGEVRLKLFGDSVAALKRYRAFGSVRGDLAVTALRDDGKGGAIARFAEIADRTAAERLRGTVLTVPRSSLPALAEGEYYHADLIGLPAVSTDGQALGVVIAVENYGAGDVLEIERPVSQDAGAGEKPTRFMVPMRVEAVPEWDDARLVITTAFAEG